MEVLFRTQRLRECAASVKSARREYGPVVGERYVARVQLLYAAESDRDLYARPYLEFHPLKGARQGQYALTLIDRMRLIVTFHDDAMTIVRVEEVSKHYGD